MANPYFFLSSFRPKAGIPVFVLTLLTTTLAAQGLKVSPNVAARRVDITFNGAPFTSYIWPASLAKPVLYPLLTPSGTVVSRGYPLQPRPGERVDHPHHAGMWFNYGNVNNFDFWNNSTAIKTEDKPKYGTIAGVRILSTESGPTAGSLTVETTWITGKGEPLLKDLTRLVFTHTPTANIIDRTTTLTALSRAVFNDDKEGLLGIRVAHFLESPTEKGGVFMDASGNPTKVDAAAPGTDTAGATGVYLTSAGKQGDAAWGTRGSWCVLNGHTPEGKAASILILDNPANPGAPTYWHARGYGLFAANPLGASIFEPKASPLKFTLEKGASTTFRYRVEFADRALDAAQANRELARYLAR